jgi:prepilin-type N-terminal cleavage/methylation domain-containing protein
MSRHVTKCSDHRQGLTLIEVLLATLILGMGITTLMAGMMSCLGVMKAAREYADAEWVLGLGELKHPIRPTEDVKEDLTVEPDALDEDLPESLRDRGYEYERTVDEEADEDKDKLFIVRTRVSWGEGTGSTRQSEEVVRYVWEHK